jgi:hypothetical protein
MNSVKIELDTGSGYDVPDELYDLLLEAFFQKARAMGLDPTAPNMMLGNWRIECELKPVE